MITINSDVFKCIGKIKDGFTHLKNIDIIFDREIKFKQKDTMFYYEPEGVKKFDHVISFDLDWTLTYNEKHLFPSETDDIKIFPNRRKMLENMCKLGYTLAIFTNQSAKSKQTKQKKVDRIITFLKEIKLPIFVYISTEEDEYRKPNIEMFNFFTQGKNIKENIFVGDALGRPQDFSDSDREFGKNINARVYSPEDFFGTAPIPSFRNKKDLIIFVGMPGSGKSTYYTKYLSEYIHISQDNLGSRAKVMKELDKSLETNKTIVVDSTNPSQEDREEYYEKAQKHGYNIKVLYFLVNGTGFNKLREKKVPNIVYHTYFKKLREKGGPPSIENTPGEVFYVY